MGKRTRATAQQRRDRIIAELVQVRGSILDTAASLSPGAQDEVFLGVWSAKDLLAHLIGWDLTNLQAAKELLAGRLPSFYAHYDHDWRTYNARLVAEHRREDFAALLAAVEDSHRQLVAYLETVPAREFDRDMGQRFRGWKVTIARLLQVEISDEQVHHSQLEGFVSRAAQSRRAAERTGRFEVRVEEGSPRGDLYELEQTTHHQVIDTRTQEVVLTFQGEMEASLSTTTGMWENYRFSGVREVTIAPDEGSVVVQYFDGREEKVCLPPR